MKNSFYLLGVLLFLSCGHMFTKERYQINYEFVDSDNISESDKKNTVDVIKKRLNKYLRNVDVILNSNQEIIATLNAGFDVDAVNQVVENQGKLDFWPCVSKDKMVELLMDIDRVTANDSLPKPFSSLIQSFYPSGFAAFKEKDMPQLREIFKNDKVQLLFKDGNKNIMLLFGLPDNGYIDLYGVFTNRTGRAPVNETHITEARQDYDQLNRPVISITMNEYGAHTWYKMTNDAYENQTNIALTLNDIVYSAPSVTAGPISGGRSQISGNFTKEQVIDLSNVLSSQQMIPKLKFISIKKLANKELQ